MRHSFLVFVILIFSFPLLSGQGFVMGKVTDRNTSEPLQGVYVMYGQGTGTLTNADGSYLLKADNSDIRITFRFIGYREIEKELHIEDGDTILLNVYLDTELKEIGQIVVSANKTEQKVAELTVSMDLLKSVDFSKNHITNTEELINKTPGIEVLDGQASIRGGTGFSYGVGSRVLALIDGLPVLSPDAGNIKWQFLPLENISQIEIIKGASSVLYGSSALNGIINFRTASASSKPDTRFFAETGVYGNPRNRNWKWWNSPRMFSDISFSHLSKVGNNDVGLGLNLSYDNGYRKFNDEALGRVSLRLKHYNKNIEGLVYGINVNSGYNKKTDFVLWENANSGALKQDTSSVSMLHGSFVAIDPYITLDKKGPMKHDLKLRFQSAVNRFPVRTNNNSNATSLYGEYQFDYRFGDFLSVIAGVAANNSIISSNLYGDLNGFNLAGFTQLEASPSSRIKIVGGIRVEHNSLDNINDKIVPIFRTGINWKVAEYTYLRGSYGQGYRYPSVAEKFAATTLGTVRIFPNPEISSETGWNAEAGVKQGLRLGEFTGQADLSIFISRNKNLIEYIFGYYPDLQTGAYGFGFQASNLEQSRIYGYELEFALNRHLGKINSTLSGGYTYIVPEEFNPLSGKSTGNYLKYRRKHSLKLSGALNSKKIAAGLDLYYKSRILNIDDVFLNEMTREEILPGFYDYWLNNNKGYFLLDGNIGYNISEKFSLSLAVKNITNKEYMGRPGDIQPQRNYSLRLTGNF
jgi:iron complex outermembrane receptor protein